MSSFTLVSPLSWIQLGVPGVAGRSRPCDAPDAIALVGGLRQGQLRELRHRQAPRDASVVAWHTRQGRGLRRIASTQLASNPGAWGFTP